MCVLTDVCYHAAGGPRSASVANPFPVSVSRQTLALKLTSLTLTCANCIWSLSFCGMLGVSPLQEQILLHSRRGLVCELLSLQKKNPKHCSACSFVSLTTALPWLVIKCSRTCSVHVYHKHMQWACGFTRYDVLHWYSVTHALPPVHPGFCFD